MSEREMILAVGLAAVLTLLICTIEITLAAKNSRVRLFVRASVLYFLISLVGNTLTTLAAASLIRLPASAGTTANPPPTSLATANQDPAAAGGKVPLLRADWPWYVSSFICAFIGVFAFTALIQQINVTFAGKGVLTIEDWISKAREAAVAAVLAARVKDENVRRIKLAGEIVANAAITDTQLNTHVDNILGPGKAAELEKLANAANGDARLAKALALATLAYDQAAALIGP